jgi:hypothetical protein
VYFKVAKSYLKAEKLVLIADIPVVESLPAILSAKAGKAIKAPPMTGEDIKVRVWDAGVLLPHSVTLQLWHTQAGDKVRGTNRPAVRNEVNGIVSSAYEDLQPYPEGGVAPTTQQVQRTMETHQEAGLSDVDASQEVLQQLWKAFKDAKGAAPSVPQLTMMLQEYAHRYKGLPLRQLKAPEGAYKYAPDEMLQRCGDLARMYLQARRFLFQSLLLFSLSERTERP